MLQKRTEGENHAYFHESLGRIIALFALFSSVAVQSTCPVLFSVCYCHFYVLVHYRVSLEKLSNCQGENLVRETDDKNVADDGGNKTSQPAPETTISGM